ncbi:MAG: histone deacetylase family protein [Xanthomonadales bacterium]|nr:histone deacetylase family protein [Xanthomonadales bacterium]
MSTAFISHPDCHDHDTGEGHPESAQRLSVIEDRLLASRISDFTRYLDAPEVTKEQLLRAHTPEYLAMIDAVMPREGYSRLDPDTVISPKTLQAAKRAAGSVILAVDQVMSGQIRNAFCCVRPPGHHAESDRALGFCIYGNIAVGVKHALEAHGLKKVAVVDFDVHQANGTEDILIGDDRVLYCSIFQHPFFPYTPIPENSERVVSIPLEASAASAEFRAAVTGHWLPALERFQPEMIFISAGFDAHRDDEMSYVNLTDADFRWVTEEMVRIADISASGRIVSALEGGYELHSLARCAESHIRVLMGL